MPSVQALLGGVHVDLLPLPCCPARLILRVTVPCCRPGAEAATIVDADGVAVPDASDVVTFTASGRAAVVGVSNGDPASHEPIRAAAHSAVTGTSSKASSSARSR